MNNRESSQMNRKAKQNTHWNGMELPKKAVVLLKILKNVSILKDIQTKQQFIELPSFIVPNAEKIGFDWNRKTVLTSIRLTWAIFTASAFVKRCASDLAIISTCDWWDGNWRVYKMCSMENSIPYECKIFQFTWFMKKKVQYRQNIHPCYFGMSHSVNIRAWFTECWALQIH